MRFAQEISIFNPFAIEKRVMALSTSITQTAREIELRAAETYATKGQMYDVESRISQTAHTISLTVRGTADKTTGAGLSISLLDEDGNVISEGSGTIKLNGNVVFTDDLSGSGSTTVNGSRIHGGTLSLGGASNGNGQLYVYDASNNEIGHWNNTGIYIKNGEIYQERYVDSDVKNAWLRIQSTEITGGYTGLGHTAMVDLQDWQWVTDTGTGRQRKEGVLNLKCTNGSVAITPDHSVFIQAPGEINMLSEAGTVMGHANLSTGTLDAAVSVAQQGLALMARNNVPLLVIDSNGAHQASTAYGTRFAPTGDGQPRRCDIINGIICNLHVDWN